jgi:hypothetical protein
VPLELSHNSEAHALIFPIVVAIFALFAVFIGDNFRKEELKVRNDFLVD